MNLNDLIQENPNLSLTIKGADLKEFAHELASQLSSDKKETKTKLLSADEVCEMLKISRPTLWRYEKHSFIKAVPIGGKKMFREDEVERVISGGGNDR